jgi:hypothetical protein
MPASCGSNRARIIPSAITASQVWFILKGEFTIDGRLCPPGTMLYHPDPHFEGVFPTATGGEVPIVQYPGPSTGRSMPGASMWRSGRRSPRSALIFDTLGRVPSEALRASFNGESLERSPCGPLVSLSARDLALLGAFLDNLPGNLFSCEASCPRSFRAVRPS